MKKIKYFAVLMMAVIIITSMPFFSVIIAYAADVDNLGVVTECIVDQNTKTLSVRGSIKHSVLVSNRDSKLAVYRFDPWDNFSVALKTAEPLETMDMTIRFEFDLSCESIRQRMSLYAVAIISPDGDIRLVSAPRYVDYYTSDTSSFGFKAVSTNDVAGAVASHPGSAVIDVYLDTLDRGNKSGYIFNADGELYYFDRDVIKELDKKVLSYTAAGTDVSFRFLISGESNSLPFCTKGNLWATNKCVVISDIQALNSIYAYTSFLISRYDGGKFGKVDGLIIGKGCDMPVLYNYASLVSEDYDTVYARSLALIGQAALEAAGNRNIALIVPVGDTLSEEGKVYASDFLESVADYIETHTKLAFTVMCESRHNPYKIDDSDFISEITPDETGEEDYHYTEDTCPYPEETYYFEDASESLETVSIETEYAEETREETSSFGDVTEVPEMTEPTETDKIIQNDDQDGYFCTDNIDTFLRYHDLLKKKYSSVNDGFAWCWYPDINTVEGALGVCYAYNYMKLATVDADFYSVSFENDVCDKFASISHLFKYIDTANNKKETAYARSVFEISDWSEIIEGYSSDSGVYHDLTESTLDPNVMDYVGSIVYLDYSSGNRSIGWFDGLYCSSLSIQVNDSESFLGAEMDLDAAGVNQSEIGYIFESPEPLLMGDALTFELKCGEGDGSLYEVAIHILSEDSTIVSKAVISGGVKCALSMDVSERDNTNGVDSIKITLKRVTGSGKCNLNLYRVLINSSSATNEQLAEEFDNIREYLRADSISDEKDRGFLLAAGLLLLSVFGVAAIVVACVNDKRTLSEEYGEE